MGELSLVRMGGGASVGCGTYTGDGNASKFIDLGVTPKWVLVCGNGAFVSGHDDYATQQGLAVGSSNGYGGYGGSFSATVHISGTGFYVYYSAADSYKARTNTINEVFNFIYGV